MIKAKTSEIVQSQVPSHHQNKTNFKSFLKAYYEWVEQEGKPAEYLQNLIENMDIDANDPVVVDHRLNQLVKFIPKMSIANKQLFAKHIKEFLVAKGSEESYKFIMNAVFGENIKMSNFSDYIFKASSSEYTEENRVSVLVENGNDFTDAIGGYLKVVGSGTIGFIEDVSVVGHDGKVFNVIKLNDKTRKGEFIPGQPVLALKRNVDRTFTEVTQYFSLITYDENEEQIVISSNGFTYNESLVGKNLIQLDSTFKATVVSLGATNNTVYTLNLTDIQGTINGNEFYLINDAIVDSHYTKLDYVYGEVDHQLIGINITKSGSGYRPGLDVKLIEGTGDGANAYIDSLTRGAVTGVSIIRGGKGYREGEEFIVYDRDCGGTGFSAIVSGIDGVGEELIPVMGLDETAGAITVVSSGSGYEVGDKFILQQESVAGLPPNELGVFEVASLANTGSVNRLISGIEIKNYGAGYQYMKLVLSIDNGAPQATGFNALGYSLHVNSVVDETVYAKVDRSLMFYPVSSNIKRVNPTGSLIDVKLISAGSAISSSGVASIKVNGYGATLSKTLSSTSFATVGVTTGGWNYVDPVIEVQQPVGDNGSGAVFSITKNGSGTITTVDVVNGGSGYTASAVVIVKERYGAGAEIVPIFTQGTGATAGGIATVTVTKSGTYYKDMPNSYRAVQGGSTDPITKHVLIYQKKDGGLGTGTGAKFDLLYQVNDILIKNGGKFFREPTEIEYTNGKGSGALLKFFITNDNDKKLERIDILNGGSGYSTKSVLTLPTTGAGNVSPSVALKIDDNGTIVGYTILSAGANIDTITYSISTTGTTPTTAPVITGTGSLAEFSVTDPGTGYYHRAEVVPLKLTLSAPNAGDGSYVLYPVLDENGAIAAVEVINPGNGVTAGGTITVGNTGIVNNVPLVPKSASFTYAVFDGRITQVTVTGSDNGFYYGTNLYVSGNGVDADIDANVETGIDSAYVVYPGEVNAYTANYEYIITVEPSASMPTAAKNPGLLLIKTNDFGQVASVDILERGSGMVNPVVDIIVDFPANPSKADAQIQLTARRKIIGVDVNNSGTNYEYAYINVRGDGQGAKIKAKLDLLGTITSLTDVTSTGYTKAPTITANDISDFGAVSRVKILNRGENYIKLPQMAIADGGYSAIKRFPNDPSVYTGSFTIYAEAGYVFDKTGHTVFGAASIVVSPTGDAITGTAAPAATWYIEASYQKLKLGALVVTHSDTIGGVKSIAMKSFGVDYKEVPLAEFPVSAVVNNTFGVKQGERVIRSDFVDAASDITDYIDTITYKGNSVFEFKLKSVSDAAVYNPFEAGTTGSLDIHVKDNISFYSATLVPSTSEFQQIIEVLDDKTFRVKMIKVSGLPAINATVAPSNVKLRTVHSYPGGLISNIDPTRSTVFLVDASEFIQLQTETGDLLMSEGQTFIQTESSAPIPEGSLLTGLSSGAEFRLVRYRRADGDPYSGGVGRTAKTFKNSTGMLDAITSMLHDNDRIQDFSYLVRTGLSLNDYKKILQESVHPAGYKIFGEVDIESLVFMPAVRLSEGQANSEEEILLEYVLEFVSLYDEYAADQTVFKAYRNRFFHESTSVQAYDNVINVEDIPISDFDYTIYTAAVNAPMMPEAKIYRTNRFTVSTDFHADADALALTGFVGNLSDYFKVGDYLWVTGSVSNNVSAVKIWHIDDSVDLIYVDSPLVTELGVTATLIVKDGEINPALGLANAEYGINNGYPLSSYEMGWEDVRLQDLPYTNTETLVTIDTTEQGEEITVHCYVGQQVEIISATGGVSLGYSTVQSISTGVLVLSITSGAASSGICTIRFNIDGRGVQ